ncbi:hypothetical protein NB703_004455 [Pantoea ananatis]|uniref:Uncharacterized protein n=1 Tax=Pantoea ananas TaxID=553 RepID=A0AAJ1FRY4_PANAN|nr:hypothetical protein [Pantoea ananatis]
MIKVVIMELNSDTNAKAMKELVSRKDNKKQS